MVGTNPPASLFDGDGNSPFSTAQGPPPNGVGYDPDDLTPGDWVRMPNPFYVKGSGPQFNGEQGCNVIYAGKNAQGVDIFVNTYGQQVYDVGGLRGHVKGLKSADNFLRTIKTIDPVKAAAKGYPGKLRTAFEIKELIVPVVPGQ